MNILISAHEFSPSQGSECAEGWNIVQGLVKNKHLNITVLYARGSQYSPNAYFNAVQEHYKNIPIESNLKLIPINQPKLTLLIAKFNRFITANKGSIGFPILYYIGYAFWQKRVYGTTKKLMLVQPIDLIHHLTQITYREPGFLWKIKIPFIWGPTGGVDGISMQLLNSLSLKQKIFELIRNLSNSLQFNFKPRIRNALKKSNLIYAFSENDRKRFSKLNSNVKILLDSGTKPSQKSIIRNYMGLPKKLNIIWVGQLIERKGLILLIRSLEKIENVNEKLKINILGNGPLINYYQQEVKKRSLTCVQFLGSIPHKKMQNVFNDSDILVHTSYREATTHVVPEALSTGLPVLCHDAFGLSIAITKECGIKIPLKSFSKSVDGFSKNIEYILNNPQTIKKLSEGAIKRSIELSWDSMVDQITKDYFKIIKDFQNK